MMDRQSQAILRLLKSETVRGRKRLQKMLYFVQEAEGEPLGFDYRMHFYGPYSSVLDGRLQALCHAGLIKSRPVGGVFSFELGQGADSHVPPSDDVDRKIQRVIGHFENQSPNRLELLGTTHYLARDLGASGQHEVDTVVARVAAWKGEKYSRKQIVAAVRELRDLGYLK
jgi:uncharacterized protein YwgA